MADGLDGHVHLTPEENAELMRLLSLGMRPSFREVLDDPLPGPLLQALSKLERVEREHDELRREPGQE